MNFTGFFSQIQETDWYAQFLAPVIQTVDSNTHLLDVGTGAGKLLQQLSKQKQVICTGVDNNLQMLQEAQKKLKTVPATLVYTTSGQVLPFAAQSFDFVTFCSILFLLQPHEVAQLLHESRRVLKPQGKIIILTPTGNQPYSVILQTFRRLTFAWYNWSFFVWQRATQKRGRNWMQQAIISSYCQKHQLGYHRSLVFNQLAQLEIIEI